MAGLPDRLPWREVGPADFLRVTHRETLAAQKALLEARDEGSSGSGLSYAKPRT